MIPYNHINPAHMHLQDQLVEAGIELPGFSDIFDADYNPFCGVDTNHLFEKYCIEHLGCLVSH